MSDAPIPLARPDLGEAELEAVRQVLESGVLSRGEQGPRLAQRIAERCGRRHGVPLNSGTAGLQAALLALGIGPGDEVITTAFSVPATLNAILAVGATPVLCDIETAALGLDPDAAAEAVTPATRAIVAVHAFGVPADIEALAALAQRHGLALVEDACEALGTRLRSGPLGAYGEASVFGFYPNKQITTGEGGVLVTDDAGLAERVELLANHGRSMDGRWLDQHLIGRNYRLSEIQAAIGNAQLDRLETFIDARLALVQRYQEALADSPLELPQRPPGCERVSWFSWVPRLPAGSARSERDELVDAAAAQGIQMGRYFAPLHLQPAIREALDTRPGQFPITEDIAARSVALPLFTTMQPEQVDRVCRFLLTWPLLAAPA